MEELTGRPSTRERAGASGPELRAAEFEVPSGLAMRLDGLALWAEGWLTRHRSVVALVVLAAAAGLAGWMLSRPAGSTQPLEDTIPFADGVPTTASSQAVDPLGQAPSIEPQSSQQLASSQPQTAEPQPTQPTDVAAELVVHVVGAVRRPGVVSVPAGARVGEVIIAAGGVADDAARDVLNLAEQVEDGMQIRVPTIEEVAAARQPSNGADRSATTLPLIRRSVGGNREADGRDAEAGPVNLNTASIDELETLPGVGPATAAAIVAWREDNSPFGSVDDLDLVPGIGPARLAAVRDLVTV